MLHFFILLFFIHTASSQATPLDLESGWRLIRQNKLFEDLCTHRNEQIKAKSKSLLGVFDPELSWSLGLGQDLRKTQVNPLEDLKFFKNNLSFKKITSFGTAYKLGFEQTVNEFKLGPTQAKIINPEYNNAFTLEFEQPFLRNPAKEVFLKKNIISKKITKNNLAKSIDLQNKQYELEMEFIKYSTLLEQVDFLSKYVTNSKKLLNESERLRKYARVSQVEVANAHSKLLEFNGNLQLSKQKLNQNAVKINYLVYPDGSIRHKINSLPLKNTWRDLPAINLESFFNLALSTRHDLNLLEEDKKSIANDLLLLSEKEKANLSLFAKTEVKTLADGFFNSFTDEYHPYYSFGVKYSLPVFKTDIFNLKQELYSKKAEVNTKIKILKNKIKNDIHMAWLDLETAKYDRQQILVQDQAINKLIKIEKELILQARSDKIAVIRYQLLKLNLKNLMSKANAQARAAEAKLRLLCHAYPGASK